MPHKNISHHASGFLLAYLLNVVRVEARQSGLAPDCVEDCAIEFAENMLLYRRDKLLRAQQNRHFDAWLHRCVRNHVTRFHQRYLRIHRRELPWPQASEDEDSVQQEHLLKSVNPAPSPSHAVFSEELWAHVVQATQTLHPDARQMFVAHYLHDASLQELAVVHSRTPDAVGKVLKRACASVRVALHQQGVTEVDLNEYLALIRTRDGQG